MILLQKKLSLCFIFMKHACGRRAMYSGIFNLWQAFVVTFPFFYFFFVAVFGYKFFFNETNQSWIFLQIGNRTILKDKGIKLKRKSQAPILKICEIINLKLPTTLLGIEFRNISQIEI